MQRFCRLIMFHMKLKVQQSWRFWGSVRTQNYRFNFVSSWWLVHRLVSFKLWEELYACLVIRSWFRCVIGVLLLSLDVCCTFFLVRCQRQWYLVMVWWYAWTIDFVSLQFACFIRFVLSLIILRLKAALPQVRVPARVTHLAVSVHSRHLDAPRCRTVQYCRLFAPVCAQYWIFF